MVQVAKKVGVAAATDRVCTATLLIGKNYTFRPKFNEGKPERFVRGVERIVPLELAEELEVLVEHTLLPLPEGEDPETQQVYEHRRFDVRKNIPRPLNVADDGTLPVNGDRRVIRDRTVNPRPLPVDGPPRTRIIPRPRPGG